MLLLSPSCELSVKNFTRKERVCDASAKWPCYRWGMHMQLPGTLLDQIDVEAEEARTVAPEPRAEVLDRVVLNRPARKVKFYFRKSRCKRCYSELSEEQVKMLLAAIRKVGRAKAENFVFADDVYLVSPGTKRLVK